MDSARDDTSTAQTQLSFAVTLYYRVRSMNTYHACLYIHNVCTHIHTYVQMYVHMYMCGLAVCVYM